MVQGLIGDEATFSSDEARVFMTAVVQYWVSAVLKLSGDSASEASQGVYGQDGSGKAPPTIAITSLNVLHSILTDEKLCSLTGDEVYSAAEQQGSSAQTTLPKVEIHDACDQKRMVGGLESLVSIAANGGAEARSSAIATMHKLSTGGDEAAGAALAGSASAVSLLVDQLSGDAAEQSAAVCSLRHLCVRSGTRSAIVDASGIAPLVSVAHAGDATARRDAALVLACLSTPPHSESVATLGGAEVLLAAVQLGKVREQRRVAGEHPLRELRGLVQREHLPEGGEGVGRHVEVRELHGVYQLLQRGHLPSTHPHAWPVPEDASVWWPQQPECVPPLRLLVDRGGARHGRRALRCGARRSAGPSRSRF